MVLNNTFVCYKENIVITNLDLLSALHALKELKKKENISNITHRKH